MSTTRLLYTETVTSEDGTSDTGIRVMHLNQPDTLNSLTTDMGAEFSAELSKLEADHGKRVLIITGSGRGFSAGGDFNFIEDRIKGEQRENATVSAQRYNY
jgi:enoyl-CoA hydratase/carnithine racemase